MLTDTFIDAFNSRIRINPNNIKTLTTEQQDRVKNLGNQAEALLKNRDLAVFIHTYKIELTDQLVELRGHTEDDDRRRVAIANQLAGLDGFVSSLKAAVYQKQSVVKAQQPPADII